MAHLPAHDSIKSILARHQSLSELAFRTESYVSSIAVRLHTALSEQEGSDPVSLPLEHQGRRSRIGRALRILAMPADLLIMPGNPHCEIRQVLTENRTTEASSLHIWKPLSTERVVHVGLGAGVGGRFAEARLSIGGTGRAFVDDQETYTAPRLRLPVENAIVPTVSYESPQAVATDMAQAARGKLAVTATVMRAVQVSHDVPLDFAEAYALLGDWNAAVAPDSSPLPEQLNPYIPLSIAQRAGA